ncbi:ABC transporter ATP-binding protein [Eubacterium sp.]|uniref:ABC transporter ATP-binding protein n=1 Tax=Eubacterium sp. TaxID=142586 RepID=UPI002589E1E8|nr:ABC transporter ATP-binding protein [Eubacterium sp.]
MPGEKAKNNKAAFGKLYGYIQKHVPAIVVAVILGGISSVIAVICPDKLSDIVNEIQIGLAGALNIKKINNICIFVLTIFILSWIFGYIQNFIMTTVTQKVTKSLRRDISQKINRVPLRYFDKTSFGDVLSRVTNDVDMIGQTLNQSIGQLISSVTLFLGSLFMMFITNVWMTLAAIASAIIGFIFMGQIMKHSQKYFIAQQVQLGALDGHIEEIYTGHNVVKAYNGEAKAEKTFDELNNKLYESAWKSQFFSGLMMPFMGFIGNLGYVAVCVLGAVLVEKNSIGFGTIVSFMIYIRLFTQPLSQMAQVSTTLQSALAASERVFEFLDEEEMEKEDNKTKKLDPANIKGEVEFRHVKFGYVPEKTIIHDFSAVAKSGQKVAIVGPTGAGKTTMVNLLMRFYEVDDGDILIDGVSTKDITRENVHSLFCMVLQDTWLFEGTLRENLAYSKEGVTDEELDEVCKRVGLHHFVRSLPKGYDTMINEQTSLSAGQKQLVTIARAMIENAPLLILDEATSSVDTKTEITVQKAMDKLTKGRTSFVIAHRLSTIKNADLILVMKDGDILETGNHEELLAKDGFYADLYNSQFEQAV